MLGSDEVVHEIKPQVLERREVGIKGELTSETPFLCCRR